MAKEKVYRYSEIFKSIQGEGKYTGVPTLWYRAWGCNFECNGFGQADPTDPDSWVLPYKDFDLIDVQQVEELPVWEYGCDSSYTWSKKFRNLAHKDTAIDIVNKLEALLTNEYNPKGRFRHPATLVDQHMAFTGGEPMMSQHALIAIMREFKERDNIPNRITVETNGTQHITSEMYKVVHDHRIRSLIINQELEWFWSVSPKLSSSGEKWNEAIVPEVLRAYSECSNYGQLKYVVDGTDKCWDEVSEATRQYRDVGIMWPVWIMPVGATVEGQDNVAAAIAEEAIERGYNVAARVHCYIWGNQIGT